MYVEIPILAKYVQDRKSKDWLRDQVEKVSEKLKHKIKFMKCAKLQKNQNFDVWLLFFDVEYSNFILQYPPTWQIFKCFFFKSNVFLNQMFF